MSAQKTALIVIDVQSRFALLHALIGARALRLTHTLEPSSFACRLLRRSSCGVRPTTRMKLRSM